MINVSIKLSVNPEDIKKDLKRRGLAASRANIGRFVHLLEELVLTVEYENISIDRETLLMRGFTFDKGGSRHGKQTV